jgi:hypothetical protein
MQMRGTQMRKTAAQLGKEMPASKFAKKYAGTTV